MKKVRMLTSMAGDNFSIAYGEEVDCEDGTADAWVEAGIAEHVGGVKLAKNAESDVISDTGTNKPRGSKKSS